MNSELPRKKILISTFRGFRNFQEKSPIFERKLDLNLIGFLSLKYHFLPEMSKFLQRIICWRFGEETIFCRGNALSFWKTSSAKIEAWKCSRGRWLSCLISQPVFSQWASFEFLLIGFLCFQLFPSEHQHFYRLRTYTTQGFLRHWVSIFYSGIEISHRLLSEERLTLPSSNQIFHDQ